MKKPIPFGKYLLLERINVGGMAEVFKAKAFGVEGFERLVAVKRILPSIAEDVEFIQMFVDEAKIAVQLTHANIGQIFDLGKVADSYFIAMEFVAGKDLRAIFDRARRRNETLLVPMACYIVMKICEGLDYAHNKRDSAGRELHLVHRDVSPQNILISYDGEVKIIDFGIAKAVGKAGKTQAGILKGKFGYMSPEQVRGLPLDRRSDVFSLGIVLYELLTGERLFQGESDFSTLERVRQVDIAPPSSYNKKIQDELEHIALKALAKDIDDRYQSAMDLHDDLQSFMYTSGNFFARKDLSSFMHKGFAEEIERETARDEEYRKITREAFQSASETSVPTDPATTSPEIGRRRTGSHAALPDPSAAASPPRIPKQTVLGMGVAPGLAPPPLTGSRPSAAAYGVARPPPPPPPTAPAVPYPGAALAPRHHAGLAMDWEEDEQSTHVFDRPDSDGPPVSATAPDAGRGSSPFAAGQPPRPIAGPPSAPPSGASRTNPFGSPPLLGPPPGSLGSPQLSLPTPLPQPPGFPPLSGLSTNPGLQPPAFPSPFDFPSPHTEDRARPTGVKREVPIWLAAVLGILAAAALMLGWVLFLRKPEPATIELSTVPRDPVVLIDNQPVRALNSPFVLTDIDPTTPHSLEVRKAGYRPWFLQITVSPGEKRSLPTVDLVPEEATIPGSGFVLETLPSGASVRVDGQLLEGRTPLRVTSLAPGRHTIVVERGPRFEAWRTEIELEPGQVRTLPQQLLRMLAASVTFASEPSGATVTLTRGGDRRALGQTPITTDVDLAAGPWSVELRKPGFEPWTGTVDSSSGEEERTVHGVLVAETPPVVGSRPDLVRRPRADGGVRPPHTTPGGGTGVLRVQTRPWSQVSVDGRVIGNTPQPNIQLPAGRHRVTLTNPDFNINETIVVDIVAGETETRVVTLTPGGG